MMVKYHLLYLTVVYRILIFYIAVNPITLLFESIKLLNCPSTPYKINFLVVGETMNCEYVKSYFSNHTYTRT